MKKNARMLTLDRFRPRTCRVAGQAMRRDCVDRARAFTLNELLIVIAITAILVALLLPSLSRAKQKAWAVDCANRQRQWAHAFVMYSEDNDGLIPREGYAPFGEVVLNNWSQVQGKLLPNGGRESDDV